MTEIKYKRDAVITGEIILINDNPITDKGNGNIMILKSKNFIPVAGNAWYEKDMFFQLLIWKKELKERLVPMIGKHFDMVCKLQSRYHNDRYYVDVCVIDFKEAEVVEPIIEEPLLASV